MNTLHISTIMIPNTNLSILLLIASPHLSVNKDYSAHTKGFMVGHLPHFFLFLFLLGFFWDKHPFSITRKILKCFLV